MRRRSARASSSACRGHPPMRRGGTRVSNLQVHGTAVLLKEGAVLLRGPSGSGKSDLALRLIEGGGRLVADDRVNLSLSRDGLIASAPETLAGLLEVRGVGILRVGHVERTRIRLVVDLVAPDEVSRLPEAGRCDFLGISVPRLSLNAFEASAPMKLRLALGGALKG